MKTNTLKRIIGITVSILLITLFAPDLEGQPNCGDLPTTENNATIALANGVIPTLNGSALPVGTYIILLYDNEGTLECGDYKQWDGNPLAFNVPGADEPGAPGFEEGEVYQYRLELPGGCVVEPQDITVSYVAIPGLCEDGETYTSDGFSCINTFTAEKDDDGAEPRRLYVKGDVAGGANDGSSWTNAFSSLSAALSESGSCIPVKEIWVAGGTYKPTSGTDRSATFMLPGNVPVYGGFNGTETSLSQRSVSGNPTILCGDIGVAGDASDNSYHVVMIRNVEKAVLDGFTIRGGNANGTSNNEDKGGGVYFSASNGGESGFYALNCTFSENNGSSGGALYIESRSSSQAKPVIGYSTFENNTGVFGGAVYNYADDSGEVKGLHVGCRFAGNTAARNGGAVFSESKNSGDCSPEFQNCSFTGNTALTGGGVSQKSSSGGSTKPEYTGCRFEGNTGTTGGAAASELQTSGETRSTFINGVFYNNTATRGGLLSNGSGCEGSFSNCTVINNTASVGNVVFNSGNVEFRNAILQGNTLGGEAPIFSAEGTIEISHSLLDVADCAGVNASTGAVDCGMGLLYNEDPLFYNSASGDFHLQPGSPALNTGDNDANSETTDMDGNLRILSGQIDLGAFEGFCVSSPLIYVKKDATGSNDGSSWENAVTDLQLALAIARSCGTGATLWVAADTYKPTTTTRRNISFNIPPNTAVYGGFAGDEMGLGDRDIKGNPTILSGDIGTEGDAGDNSYHVVVAFGSSETTILDGFTVQDGNADEQGASPWNKNGGGLVVDVIDFKYQSDDYLRSGRTSSPQISNCHFTQNTASKYGGGIYNNAGGNGAVSPLILSCIFSENVAEGGGGMACSSGENSSAKVESVNCLFTGNTAEKGGGVYQQGKSSVLNITSVTFADNTATNDGKALWNEDGGTATLSNGILWDAGGIGGSAAFVYNMDGTVSVSYSLVQSSDCSGLGSGNTPPACGEGMLYNMDPLFEDAGGGDYTPQEASPAVNAGNNGSLPTGITLDLAENTRVVSDTIDMGALEFQAGLLPVELLYLTAGAADTYIRLEWLTITEFNNSGFEIQRSLDGHSFKKIGWVEGRGTTVESEKYLYHDTDVIPGKTYYYRLKQIDWDGRAEWSEIVDARIDRKGEILVNVYPNPVREILYVGYQMEEGEAINIELSNSMGQRIYSIVSDGSAEGVVEIETGSLPAGLYLLTVCNEAEHYVQKIVVD